MPGDADAGGMRPAAPPVVGDDKSVKATDTELLKMEVSLQKLILDNGFITPDAVKQLALSGVRTVNLFYMLGNNSSPAQTQVNLGRSLSSFALSKHGICEGGTLSLLRPFHVLLLRIHDVH